MDGGGGHDSKNAAGLEAGEIREAAGVVASRGMSSASSVDRSRSRSRSRTRSSGRAAAAATGQQQRSRSPLGSPGPGGLEEGDEGLEESGGASTQVSVQTPTLVPEAILVHRCV